jgi:hypothetical protein
MIDTGGGVSDYPRVQKHSIKRPATDTPQKFPQTGPATILQHQS